MKKGRIIVCFIGLISLLSSFGTAAADIRVGLYYSEKVQSAVFSVVEGNYILLGDERQVALLEKGAIIHLDYSTGKVTVNDTARLLGTFQTVTIRGMSSVNVFLVKPVYPSLDARESDDDLIIGTYGEGLRIINRLDLEKYVAGTIEAEGGVNEGIEYYKAQAVLARTYAVMNFNRHAPEGFNLCDEQHCQAFHGKSRWNPKIYDATLATENQILIGPDNQTGNHGLSCQLRWRDKQCCHRLERRPALSFSGERSFLSRIRQCTMDQGYSNDRMEPVPAEKRHLVAHITG